MGKPDKARLYKVQRPVTTNGMPTALIYNQSLKDLFEMTLDKKLLNFMGADLKVYVYGRRENDKFLYEEVKQPNPGW